MFFFSRKMPDVQALVNEFVNLLKKRWVFLLWWCLSWINGVIGIRVLLLRFRIFFFSVRVFDLVLNCYFVISSYWFCCCDVSKIEGSQATAKQTAELLRSVISHQRLPHTNQATSLINAVRAVGEKIIDANPIGIYIKFSYFLIL